jgi:UDP-N-acetylmuramoyl-L-alanyl-D-glutamate--2,6-diaminopimelate ligase
MNLLELAAACGATLRGTGRTPVTGITHRAQDTEAGWVFAALPGQHHHGMEFVADALSRGAVAVLSDRDPGSDVAWLETDRPRRATALAAWALANHPEARLRLVGITGTNGKSTVVDLVGRIAAAAGEAPGTFGTLAYTLPQRHQPASRTTPEAPDLAPLLAALVEQGGTIAVVEVSSHALALDRVAGLEFDVAVWTNLSRDHLDFHSDLESYFATKRRLADLLRRDPPGRRAVAADDPFMARLLAEPRAGDVAFGLEESSDVTARELHLDEGGSSFVLTTREGAVDVRLPLIGRHNVHNALAAAAAAVALGWPLHAVAAGLGAARPLPGRLEPVKTALPFPLFVDYAHTPDALQKVVGALREITAKRLIVVFGCGGDRDRGKRAPMGETVGRLADVPIVTSDNPRSEDPNAIIASVMEGVRSSGNVRALAIPDRREAIAAALAVATDDSVVLVAGKGHETVQVFADRTVPFDDREVIRDLARKRST